VNDEIKEPKKYRYPPSKRSQRACEICCKVFRDNSCLKKHTEKIHLRLKPYLCDICARNFSDRREYFGGYPQMMSWQKSTFQSPPWNFPEIVYRDTDLWPLLPLKSWHHLRMTPIKQEIILKMCRENIFSGSLIYHMSSHLGVSIQCRLCPRKFSNEKALQKHHIYVHSENKPYICEICGAKYVRPYLLRNHIKSHNQPAKEKNHSCEICEKK
jgi:hypothetical protein